MKPFVLSDAPDCNCKRRMPLRGLVVTFILWQAAIPIIGVGAALLGVGRDVPSVSPKVKTYVESLLDPSPDSVAAAWTVFDNFRLSSHDWVSGSGRADSIAHLGRAYQIGAPASKRIEAMTGFLAAASSEHWSQELEGVREAIVRIAARVPECADAVAENLAALAEYRRQRADEETARELYRSVADRFPGTRAWGRCAFNTGYLLRRKGYPEQAVTALRPILSSSVNDRDPGGRLMEAYRNYRHRTSVEVSDSFHDMNDFLRAYFWRLAAFTRYPYQSWCGTCGWSARARLRDELLISATLAGPFVLLAHLVLNPLMSWKVWLGLGLGWTGYRTGAAVGRWRRRNRRNAATPMT